MNVCGVEIKGNDAIICLLKKVEDTTEIINNNVLKVSVADTGTPVGIRTFQDTFQKVIEQCDIDKVIIKERMTKGRFAGGAMSFKIEAAIQLIQDLDVVTVSGNALSRYEKSSFLPVEFDDTNLCQYQKQAYIAANYLMFHNQGDVNV